MTSNFPMDYAIAITINNLQVDSAKFTIAISSQIIAITMSYIASIIRKVTSIIDCAVVINLRIVIAITHSTNGAISQISAFTKVKVIAKHSIDEIVVFSVIIVTIVARQDERATDLK